MDTQYSGPAQSSPTVSLTQGYNGYNQVATPRELTLIERLSNLESAHGTAMKNNEEQIGMLLRRISHLENALGTTYLNEVKTPY